MSDTTKALDALFNSSDQPHGSVFPADVQQKVLIKEEGPEESRPDVDQQDPEPLGIKEEEEQLLTGLEREQLKQITVINPTRFSFTAVSLMSEKDEEKLLSQLHEDQEEDGDLPTCSSADQMITATGGEDLGNEETVGNSGLKTDDDSYSSETEVSEDDKDGNNSDSQLKLLSDPESKIEDCGKDRKKTIAPKTGVTAVNKNFICSKCGEQFLHYQSLHNHMTRHLGKEFSSCLVNEKCVKVKKNVDLCKKIQTRLKSLICGDCGKRFTKTVNLNKHMKIHTGEKLFACDVCGYRFGRKTNLNTHMRIHTGEKPFACDFCGVRFRVKINLITHVRVHTGEKPFVCDACGRKFSEKTSLNTHARLHTGQKPFVCDVCGHQFRHKTALNEHMRIHTGEKPFDCDVCGQRFRQKTALNTHTRIHTGEKPYDCEVCGQQFRLRSHLNSHIRIHTGQKPFPCDVCGQRFSIKTNLKRHMRIHTKGKMVSL